MKGSQDFTPASTIPNDKNTRKKNHNREKRCLWKASEKKTCHEMVTPISILMEPNTRKGK